MSAPDLQQKKALVGLKEIVGSMIFGASRPLSVNDIRKCLTDTAEAHGQEAKHFADIKPSDIKRTLEELQREIDNAGLGILLREKVGGFRFQTDPRCGPWLKSLLERKKSNRLSRPGLETLAILAYRQPMTKADIERIRGVSVDHVLKALMEGQLIRIVGRSELPGRPFLYGTTQLFLEHFGLKSLDDLQDREILSMLKQAATAGSPPEPADADAAANADDEDAFDDEDVDEEDEFDDEDDGDGDES